ncbi:IS5 family transposase [Kitasatospora sp. NPDC048540]|uniref:IS5 family transposase n=1 Tax=Kitasatospora sp. NPDC048540 TaxID=3155634 RepID=UPI00340AB8A1
MSSGPWSSRCCRQRGGSEGGRWEKHPQRRIVNAIFYVVPTGCAWRQLPKGFAPWPTVYWYFTWWHDDSTVERIHDALRCKVREADGRDTEPSAGLIDSQSVRTADTVPADTRGFDAGKKVKGCKRFSVTDTLGLLLAVHVVAASMQDRDGAKRPLLWTRLDHPGVKKIWADQGFAGRLVEWAAQILGRDLEIVRKDPGQRGFQVQPKRWTVDPHVSYKPSCGALNPSRFG